MPPGLTFHPVRAEDKPRILDITARTWGEDEGDYIQYVFDDWLADPGGEFTAVELDGQVVGIAKLTDLGSGEWWFEGLRVDPVQRRKGIAAAINRYQVDLARRLGGKVIRYMTSGDNVGSQTIGLKAGFQHVLTYTSHVAGALSDSDPPVRLTTSDLPALYPWLDSPLLRHTHGLYRNGWTVRALTETALRRVLESGNAYGLKDRSGRVRAWGIRRAEEADDETDRLRIDHIDGDLESISLLARAFRSLAASHRKEVASVGVVDYPPLLSAISPAGYRPNPDGFKLWVMDLKL